MSIGEAEVLHAARLAELAVDFRGRPCRRAPFDLSKRAEQPQAALGPEHGASLREPGPRGDCPPGT